MVVTVIISTSSAPNELFIRYKNGSLRQASAASVQLDMSQSSSGSGQ